MTVGEMLERMDSREFAEWQIVYAHDPFGELRADRRTALLAMQFYNAHRGKEHPARGLDDFVLYKPFVVPETDEEAASRILSQARALTARQQGIKQWRR